MTFPNDFTIKDRIELLERSILVNSLAYYEMDENILLDYQYDHNTQQLEELARESPKDFKKSRYYRYFQDFCSTEEGVHNSTGFDLVSRISKNKKLYRKIERDATWALKLKQERGVMYK